MTIDEIIKQIDWTRYENSIVALLRTSCEQFAAEHSDTKVFQVSIWTDGQAGVSAVSFETRAHALEHVARWAKRWRELGNETTAHSMESEGTNENPADFEFSSYKEYQHPELSSLRKYDFMPETGKDIRKIDSATEKHLLSMLNVIRNEKILTVLPNDGAIWIGISSPDDWYDHVELVEL